MRLFALLLTLTLALSLPATSAHGHARTLLTPMQHSMHDITRAMHAIEAFRPQALDCSSCQLIWGTVGE